MSERYKERMFQNIDKYAILLAARKLGLRVVPMDTREGHPVRTWREGAHVDQEMFNVLEGEVFSRESDPWVIVVTGRNHAGDFEHIINDSTHLENDDFVKYRSEGPSLGHLLRERFRGDVLTVNAYSDEQFGLGVGWMPDLMELSVKPAEKGFDLRFDHHFFTGEGLRRYAED